jgi:hypothetical protein
MVTDLKQVLRRIENHLGLLEGNLSKNAERLKHIESYTASRIMEARKMLPLVSDSNDWETRLLTTIDLLSEIETLISKMNEISIENVDEVSLEGLVEQCNVRPTV